MGTLLSSTPKPPECWLSGALTGPLPTEHPMLNAHIATRPTGETVRRVKMSMISIVRAAILCAIEKPAQFELRRPSIFSSQGSGR